LIKAIYSDWEVSGGCPLFRAASPRIQNNYSNRSQAKEKNNIFTNIEIKDTLFSN
jgi:hypothetical protein